MRSIAVAAIAGLVSAGSYDLEDLKFIMHSAKFGLSWANVEEYNFRKGEYLKNDAMIAAHNSTESNYKLGHNKFSSWTPEEMKGLRGLKKRTEKAEPKGVPPVMNQTFPQSWDWISMGCVSPIQDQGQCGSCWAFSATAALESANCVAKGNTGLTKISEQQVVDCCGSRYNCAGCNGGWQY
jgi:C1A family cysteine protease